jgi:hypothetical protein
MVAGIHNRAESKGMMPPMFGDITPESVAYQCVIAGARPAELPVVLAAAQATLEPDFNLLGITTTTGTACVALCVHGPIARQLGINAGTNCLGPGTAPTPASAAPCSSASATSAAPARTPATWRPWASRASTRCASPSATMVPSRPSPSVRASART